MNRRLLAGIMAMCVLSSALFPVNCALADSEVQSTAVEETEKPKPTEKPTPKPEEKPEEKATERSVEEAKETPEEKPEEKKEKAEEKPSETSESKEKPAEKPSEAPEDKEKPQDKPSEKPEEKPAETGSEDKKETTPAPTQAATKAPEAPVTKAPEQTEAPETTTAPEQEPTKAPETQQPSDAPTAGPATTPAPEATESPAVSAEPGTTLQPDITVVPEVTGEPESTEEPETDELSIRISGAPAYIFSGDEITVKIKVSGGTAPYSVSLRVLRDGDSVSKDKKSMEEPGSFKFDYTPKKYGEYTFKATVTDADGNTAETDKLVPVASHETEDRDEWEKTMEDVILTGDWRTDILAIARTQLGYRESTKNFVVHDDGHLQGYTRYGDWYGKTYYEWCGMFVAFCASYAGIPKADFPRDNISAHWREDLIKRDAYEEDSLTYIPQPGDLIYFNWENRESKRLSDEPEHIGIVEKVKDDMVHTIEGNSGKKVRRREYKLDDPAIIGYCNTAKLMQAAGIPTETEVLLPVEEEAVPEETDDMPVSGEPSAKPETADEIPADAAAASEPAPLAEEVLLPVETAQPEPEPTKKPAAKSSKSGKKKAAAKKTAAPSEKPEALPAEPELIPDKGIQTLLTEAPLLADEGIL